MIQHEAASNINHRCNNQITLTLMLDLVQFVAHKTAYSSLRYPHTSMRVHNQCSLSLRRNNEYEGRIKKDSFRKESERRYTMSMKDALSKIVGKENVSDTAGDLLLYSHDESLLPAGTADVIVWPGSSQEVADVVKYACDNNVPVIPASSRTHVYGSTIPKQGGMIVDMKRMNKILEIDTYNRLARVEAGVTWKQLTEALDKEGMRCIMPLVPRPDSSVLTSLLEREVPTNIVYDYGEPTQSMEIVWADGSLFRAGSASVNGFPDSMSKGGNPSGPGLDFYRFMQGAQGTMGIVTWISMKIEFKTKIDKIYMAPVTDLTYANNFLHRILPRRIGQECLILNNIDLAGIIATNDDEFTKLSETLPPWTMILSISGVMRRPEEKIAYEEHFLEKVLTAEFSSLDLKDRLDGFPGIERKLMPLLRAPWPADVKYWKNRLRGGYQDLFYITRPGKAAEQIKIMDSIAAKHGYAIGDIGKYIQPIEHNRASQVEFTLFYTPEDEKEKAAVEEICHEAITALMEAGAFFSRPYGEAAEIVYDRAANYTAALKRVKKVFDPKNIMNPGNLCF